MTKEMESWIGGACIVGFDRGYAKGLDRSPVTDAEKRSIIVGVMDSLDEAIKKGKEND